MSRFKDIILEALTDNGDISKLLELVKPELQEQCQGLSINNDGQIVIRLNDSQYTVTLQPVSILTKEEAEFNEGEEQVEQKGAIDPTVLSSLDTLSQSPNQQIANSAQKTLNGLNQNINNLGNALISKTNEMIANVNK